jgi:hypothetical protein
MFIRNRDSDWLPAGRPRFRSSSPQEGKIFHFSMFSRPTLVFIQPLIEWVVKRPERAADHSPPTSVEVKKFGSIRGVFKKYRTIFEAVVPLLYP